MSKKETEARFAELAQAGVIIDSGQRRNGQIVWVVNPALTEEECQRRLRALEADEEAPEN